MLRRLVLTIANFYDWMILITEFFSLPQDAIEAMRRDGELG